MPTLKSVWVLLPRRQAALPYRQLKPMRGNGPSPAPIRVRPVVFRGRLRKKRMAIGSSTAARSGMQQHHPFPSHSHTRLSCVPASIPVPGLDPNGSGAEPQPGPTAGSDRSLAAQRAGISQAAETLTRRRFLTLGSVAGVGLSAATWRGRPSAGTPAPSTEHHAQSDYLTRDEDFVTVGRGKPPPHDLPIERRRAVGLVPETWRLEVVPDPESGARLDRPLTREAGTAMDWEGLLRLAERAAVRFLCVMSCTNMKRPLGMGLWEGVPLREVIRMVHPTANVRRVFYYGWHNDDLSQRFQSSLTLDRVLEELPGELPVVLCYKLNGQWLSPKRGGPVRLLVPGAYGNKSVKWLQRVVLTNNPRLNDTYADWNNDTESQLKTYACCNAVPETLPASRPWTLTGLAQVGPSGLSEVQYALQPKDTPVPSEDPYLAQLDWRTARILPPPDRWGGGLPEGKLPVPWPLEFDSITGRPRSWPLRYTVAHWAATLTDLRPGAYDLRCRTIDLRGVAQPLPRPLLKSGYNAIQKVTLTVLG
ncbi:MAG: hypothetical protein FJ387_16235 [Verrucomicrobia bacterium]|nr:hypothetical protein [Verrucomicrobiota bacterium]